MASNSAMQESGFIHSLKDKTINGFSQSENP